MLSNEELQERFYQAYSPITEETILEWTDSAAGTAEMNNVVIGLAQKCYGAALIDETHPLRYNLFFVYGGNKELEGDLISLSVDEPERERLVLFFANFLSRTYGIKLLETFNTFQFKTRSLLEKFGYLTFSSTDIGPGLDPNPLIIAKNKKGIVRVDLIKPEEFYSEFFSNPEAQAFKEGESHVYLMLNSRNGCVKIGKSKNPGYRERTLQSEEPQVKLIACWLAPQSVERELHKCYSDKRERGEWFDLDFNDLQLIKEKMLEYVQVTLPRFRY